MAEYCWEEDHEKIEVQRHADCVDIEASGSGYAGERSLPAASDQFSLLLARSLPLGCKWKSRFGGLSVSELRRNRELEAENSKLKRMYAEMAMENHALKDLIEKKL